MSPSPALELDVPRGQRVIVFSDLRLDEPDLLGRASSVLTEIDESVTVVLTGLTARSTQDWDNPHPAVRELVDAISHIAIRARSTVIVVENEQNHTAPSAFQSTPSLRLRVETAKGPASIDVRTADGSDARANSFLDDPQSSARWETNHLSFYQRLKWLAWAPLALNALLIATSLVIGLVDVVDPNGTQWIKGAPHFTSFGVASLALFLAAVAEAGFIGAAGWLGRRRLRRRRVALGTSGEILDDVFVDSVPVATATSAVIEERSLGLIVGGAARPVLVELENGFCASPGPSHVVYVERAGRLGMPSVFQPVRRTAYIDIQTGPAFSVRLVAGGTRLPTETLLEGLVAAAPVLVAPPGQPEIIATWPNGAPWPPTSSLQEAQRRQRRIRRLISGVAFLTGLGNVVSAIVPPTKDQLHQILNLLPLGIAQGAAAATAFAGIGMIMLARGLRRGQRRARIVATVLYGITGFVHLFHSAQLFTTVFNLLVLLVLVTNRDAFRGETDRGSIALAAPRLASAALGAVATSTVLAVILGRLPWGLEWWRAFLASAQRLVGVNTLPLPDRVDDFAAPTLLTVGVVIVIGALYLVTRPVVDRRMSQHAFSQRERRLSELRARDIVRRHGRGTLDYFALRDDKQFFFFHDSLVAYAVYGGVALISPDPIGPSTERSGVLAAFQRFAEQRGWTIAVIGASEQWLPFYQAVGLHQIYVGDEAVVNCQTFSLEGGKMKGLRQACTRLARNGYTVEFVDPSTISRERVAGIVDLMGKLRRGEGERGFSMMLGRMFHSRDRGLLLTIVSAPDGSPAAICQFVPSPAINGYSLDLMRRDPDEHPNGLIDYALCSTIAHLREQGARGLSLNFAAFRSVLDGEKGDGTFTKVERWALRRLSGVLPIETLWSFNAKYLPEWQPRYLVYPSVEHLVPVVAAVLRAESLTEIPVFGRFLANDPMNRPGTVVPQELLEGASNS